MKWNAFTQFPLEVTIYIALLDCVKEFISLPISKLEAKSDVTSDTDLFIS